MPFDFVYFYAKGKWLRLMVYWIFSISMLFNLPNHTPAQASNDRKRELACYIQYVKSITKNYGPFTAQFKTHGEKKERMKKKKIKHFEIDGHRSIISFN